MSLPKRVIHLTDRGRETSLFFWTKWKGCGRRAYFSEQAYIGDAGEGSFIGSQNSRAAIGTMTHALLELHFRGEDILSFAPSFATDLDPPPPWSLDGSLESTAAIVVATWFIKKFPRRVFGEIVSVDSAVSDYRREDLDRVVWIGGAASTRVWTDGEAESPIVIEPRLTRHQDLICRLGQAEADELSGLTGAVFLPGLHVFDWKTTDYASRGDRYDDGLDVSSYRHLARINFARHNEPVFFTYFLIPIGKGAEAKPSAAPIPMGTEDQPGLDAQRVNNLVRESIAHRSAALSLHPQGLVDVSYCRDRYGNTCPYYLGKCDRT